MSQQAVRDPRAAAIRAYLEAAARLREQARDAFREGYPSWFYELTGMVVIVERAAKAEMADRPPRPMP